jgi:hypothetical protein
VALDLRKLRPVELCRLLNSTPTGEVIGERQLHRHRTRAGLRITTVGEPRSIDLLRYVGWLASERHKSQPEPEGLIGYEAHKERARQRNLELSLSGRDIGELPQVVDPDRHQRCADSFRLFCETYFPQRFQQHGAFWPWSDDHLTVMSMIERVVREGGQFAVAMPRGSGKTVLCECAVLWAVLYGYHAFVGIFGPTEEHARARIKNFRAMLTSPTLAEDFPQACYPILRLEGIHQRRLLYQGRAIQIDFKSDAIQLPNIPGPSSGSVIYAAGLTGQIRGPNVTRDDGSVMRPSLVLIDDPQTRESARSPSQCATREQIINGDVLGLAGPGEEIAAMIPCTVIYPNDLADRILDREINPQWQGVRTSMVTAWPTDTDLWGRYAEIRREAHLACAGNRRQLAERCNTFYQQNREAMDAGAATSWSARKSPLELSSIQHAWNLRIDRSDHVFFAEYQNEPLPEERADGDLLTADQIAAKVNGLKRGEVPIGCTHLTMFVDVQGKALFYMIAAWEDDFTGYVIDYGTEPDQEMPYFTLRDLRHTLAEAAPRAGLEGAIYAGLERLTEARIGREWRRDDGAMVRIDRCLIDAGWGRTSDVIYQFCRQSKFAHVLLPSHGRYVGASSMPFSEYRRKRGDRVGLNWRIPLVTGARSVRHALFDTNFWKSFVHERLAVSMGDPGCLSLFGQNADRHRLLAEHLTAEYRVKTEGRGRSVDEWKLRAEGSDNHWLDCLVGCAVAASMKGASLPGLTPPRRKRRKVSLAEAMGRA